MEAQNLNEAPQQALRKTDVMCSVYWWLYVVSKLGMIYSILIGNWIAVVGFTIASIVTYIQTMKRS
jgi:hypothetical protein